MGSLYLLVVLAVFLLIVFLIIQHFNSRILLLKQKISALDEKINDAMKLIEKNRLLIEDNKESIMAQNKARKEE